MKLHSIQVLGESQIRIDLISNKHPGRWLGLRNVVEIMH